MNFTKSKSIATGLAAALFVTVFAIGCDNGGEKKEATTDSPKMEAPKMDSPKMDAPKMDSPKVDSPKMGKADVKPVVKP